MDGLASETQPRRTPAHPLDERILAFMREGAPAESDFDRLALDVFAYQYDACAPYRRYCDRVGVTPGSARAWRHVPAVPAASFGDARLACFPPERATVAFESSGTLRAGAPRSRHELETTALYDESLARHFAARVGDGFAFLALMPSPGEAPRSSLSYMLGELMRRTPDEAHCFGIRDGRIDLDACSAWLAERRAPVCVFAPAFAFVHFVDACRARGLSFALPAGSVVVETGGLKGRAREVSRYELVMSLTAVFGIGPRSCISEYGMCELGSQWYDGRGPGWARTLVVDPITGDVVHDGDVGLLQVFDLANRGSVAAVLTADLSRAVDRGIALLGRHPGAPPKGCSIAVDAMLAR